MRTACPCGMGRESAYEGTAVPHAPKGPKQLLQVFFIYPACFPIQSLLLQHPFSGPRGVRASTILMPCCDLYKSAIVIALTSAPPASPLCHPGASSSEDRGTLRPGGSDSPIRQYPSSFGSQHNVLRTLRGLQDAFHTPLVPYPPTPRHGAPLGGLRLSQQARDTTSYLCS